MLTIEKFYFNFDEAAPYIVMGADSTDWHIEFVGENGSPSIRITMRGRDNFRRLIEHLHSAGMGLVNLPSRRDEAHGVAPPAAPVQP